VSAEINHTASAGISTLLIDPIISRPHPQQQGHTRRVSPQWEWSLQDSLSLQDYLVLNGFR